MSPKRVDHTAIVVYSIDEASARFQHLLGFEPTDRMVIAEQRVEVAFLAVGDTRIELIQPLDENSSVAKFLQKRGEALHHVGIAVHDIHAEMRRMTTQGYALIDDEPRRGAHGLIAFIHPRAAGGVLFELVQNDLPGA